MTSLLGDKLHLFKQSFIANEHQNGGMGYNQILFIVEIDLIGGILQIDSQVALLGLQGQIVHLSLLLFPDLMFVGLRRQGVAGTGLDDVARLDAVLLDSRGQIETGLGLALRILRFDQHLVANHQKLVNIFSIDC